MKKPNITASTWAIIIEQLTLGANVNEITEETGLHRYTVQDYLRVLKRRKTIHICGWDQDVRGAWVLARYKLGEGKDAKRPGRRKQSVRCKEYRAKLKTRELFSRITGVHLRAEAVA